MPVKSVKEIFSSSWLFKKAASCSFHCIFSVVSTSFYLKIKTLVFIFFSFLLLFTNFLYFMSKLFFVFLTLVLNKIIYLNY